MANSDYQREMNTIRKPQMYTSMSGPYITDNRTPFVNSKNNSIYNAAVSKLRQFYDQKVKYENEYASLFEEAKTSNEDRYNDILAGFDNLYSGTMTEMQGMGDSAKKDVNAGYDQALAGGMQGLVSSGMASTTMMPTLHNANTRERSDALGRVNESLRKEKTGYMNNITNNKLAFMERRKDAYPDQNLYMSLINKYADSMGNLSQPSYTSFGSILSTVDP